jgi:hypothetical protein
VYSWIFQAVLSLMAIMVAVVAFATGNQRIDIQWLALPTGNQMPFLIGLGIVGLLCVLLAIRGTVRTLLFLFAIHSAYMLIKGLFMSSYSFSGPEEARNAAILVAGAILAVIGSFPVSTRSRAR